ncbi:MAG: TadE/TadG family type IV pilus assembly protein [Acidimicrobiia bacterium]
MRLFGRERGATLIEASLIMPIMILIMISTLELGLAFKDYLTISYASREGSRVGALAGNEPTADCEIVHSIIDILGAANLNDFQRIEIFAADPATGNQILAKTNTWALVGSDPYDCANDWTIVENWPAATRNVVFGPSSTLDIIGVRIIQTHNYITGMPPFRGSFDVDEVTITRMEPEAFE